MSPGGDRQSLQIELQGDPKVRKPSGLGVPQTVEIRRDNIEKPLEFTVPEICL